jgi:DNA-binding NarL/FixJ family response regulator
VLLVEDSDAVRRGVESTLKNDKGLALVGSFVDGESAVAAIEKGLAFEVALVDLGLPGIPGFDVIKAIRKHQSLAAAIVLTIWDDPPNVVKALRSGARGYLLKDTSPDRIRAAIRDAREGGTPLTPSVARFIVEAMLQGNAPPSDDEPELEALTTREREVLDLLARGLTYSDTARVLGIGLGTVQSHVKRIYEKLEVTSKAEATAVAIRRGILEK